MASTTTTLTSTTGAVASVYLAQQLALFPPPLHVRKKSRKLRLRFAQRKVTRHQHSPACGPLDDIINEIAVDISPSKRNDTYECPTDLDKPTLLAVDPLPVSRTPSHQPLAVRKTRSRNTNSRSTASGSTCSDVMASSRLENLAKVEYTDRNAPVSADAAQRRLGDPFPAMSDFNHTTPSPDSFSNQRLRSISGTSEGASKLHPADGARKRFFSLSNGIEKLRLRATDQSSAGSQTSLSQRKTPPTRVGPAAGTSENMQAAEDELSAWWGKYGHRASMIQAVYSKAAEHYPSPHEFRQELPTIDDDAAEAAPSASTLAAAVKITPEVKLLTENEEVFWVAIEVEGVLHNRRPLSYQAVDVVFVVDNAYYVTEDCLERACDLLAGAFYNLKKGDRVALYTTHCAHEAVTGTVPDMWYPLSSYDNIAADIVRDMASDIREHGTQAWRWPRPNPPMSEVLISITKSLEARDFREKRTHIMLLSPAMRELHDVSKLYPSVHVHQINPAILPFNGVNNAEELMCMDMCCRNITYYNHAHFQSSSDRVRQLLRHARSEKPTGMICNVHVDLRRRPGCEVLRCEGSPDIPQLRLGQVHSLFAEVRVIRSITKEMDLESNDPVRDSTLAANNLMQDLKNAIVLGASKVHILSVQLLHQNSMLPSTHWTFTESPLLVLKELGRLSLPTDRALELYKRRFFSSFTRLPADSRTERVIEHLISMVKPELTDACMKILVQMGKEVDSHRDIVQYEKTRRAHLPSCTGPVPAPYAHQFLLDKWETRKKKRMGHYVA